LGLITIEREDFFSFFVVRQSRVGSRTVHAFGAALRAARVDARQRGQLALSGARVAHGGVAQSGRDKEGRPAAGARGGDNGAATVESLERESWRERLGRDRGNKGARERKGSRGPGFRLSFPVFFVCETFLSGKRVHPFGV
jgi:hypothetical protein